MDLIRIGEEIREARRDRRWSQEDLAKASGVSRSRIAGVENGRLPEVGFQLLRRVLIALDLDLRITDFNSGRPTLEQLVEENEREMNARPRLSESDRRIAYQDAVRRFEEAIERAAAFMKIEPDPLDYDDAVILPDK